MTKVNPADVVTSTRILQFCKQARPDIVETLVTDAPTLFVRFGLDTDVRISHFMAQIAHETGGLVRLDENMMYTRAASLVRTFPSRFKNETEAAPYVRKPEKIANRAYSNRLGNGDEASGDGWAYRGSGLIQLTGRENFREIGKLVGMGDALEKDPEQVRLPDSALLVSLGYWKARNINAQADGATDKDVEDVTKLINPALMGLGDRKALFKQALKVFAAPRPAAAPRAATRPRSRTLGASPMAAAASNLSGADWVAQFPTSRSIDDLREPFRTACGAFVKAMRDAGATVTISATYRPPQRAYLMHWSWRIAKKEVDPALVTPMPGVDIQWVHGSLAASRKAAAEMVAAYGMVHKAALNSRHTEAAAIDMTISWSGTLKIKLPNGQTRAIASQPRNGGNAELVQVGAAYKVIKLPSDPPHWSDDGR
jgi:predicted chitinase/D-alanyl-D-alanine dipeptidase